MAVYSMTGYASVQGDASRPAAANPNEPGTTLGLELRSVNSRFLDLTLKLPEELRGTEPGLRELVAAQLKRGKVELRAWVEGRADSVLRPPSASDLQKMSHLQDTVLGWSPTARPLSVLEMLQLGSRQSAAPGLWHDDLLALAARGLSALAEARMREGDRLALTLLQRLQALRQLAQQAAPLIPQLVAQQRQRFLDRWNDAMGVNGSPVDPGAAQERALTEATAFAIRIDVAEELTRLDAHLDEIERLLKKGGELGKRLDFLIQELHREANTLGAKSSTLELSRISVDMKVLIEQMREQVQNIE